MSSKCFPLLVVNLQLFNIAMNPRIISPVAIPPAYLLPLAACNTSKFKSRKLFNKEMIESSLGILIYNRELALFMTLIFDSE